MILKKWHEFNKKVLNYFLFKVLKFRHPRRQASGCVIAYQNSEQTQTTWPFFQMFQWRKSRFTLSDLHQIHGYICLNQYSRPLTYVCVWSMWKTIKLLYMEKVNIYLLIKNNYLTKSYYCFSYSYRILIQFKKNLH